MIIIIRLLVNLTTNLMDDSNESAVICKSNCYENEC